MIRGVDPFFFPFFHHLRLFGEMDFDPRNVIVLYESRPESCSVVLLPSAPCGDEPLGIGLPMILFDAAAFISCVSNPSVEPVERMGSEQTVHVREYGDGLSQFFPAFFIASELQGLFIMSVSEFPEPK